MILSINGPKVTDYAEHECLDDLSARTFVYRTAVNKYNYSRGEAQNASILASRAFRAGRPFQLNGWTFTLSSAAA